MSRRDPPGTDYYDFVYDAEDQLTQAKKNGAVIATFTYDGDGRRVKSVIGSATTVFVGVTTK
jgi:YD repeat-containing protein